MPPASSESGGGPPQATSAESAAALASLFPRCTVRVMLERLRCGVITTGAFRAHLAQWHEETEGGNFGLIPHLDYVRFATGDRAGQAYASLLWQPLNKVKAHEIFEIGGIRVYLSKPTRTALKEHCLDAKDGAIFVR